MLVDVGYDSADGGVVVNSGNFVHTAKVSHDDVVRERNGNPNELANGGPRKNRSDRVGPVLLLGGYEFCCGGNLWYFGSPAFAVLVDEPEQTFFHDSATNVRSEAPVKSSRTRSIVNGRNGITNGETGVELNRYSNDEEWAQGDVSGRDGYHGGEERGEGRMVVVVVDQPIFGVVVRRQVDGIAGDRGDQVRCQSNRSPSDKAILKHQLHMSKESTVCSPSSSLVSGHAGSKGVEGIGEDSGGTTSRGAAEQSRGVVVSRAFKHRHLYHSELSLLCVNKVQKL